MASLQQNSTLNITPILASPVSRTLTVFPCLLNSSQEDEFTPEGYRVEVVEKIEAAIEADPIPVPSDSKGYFAWLKNPKK